MGGPPRVARLMVKVCFEGIPKSDVCIATGSCLNAYLENEFNGCIGVAETRVLGDSRMGHMAGLPLEFAVTNDN